MIPFVIVAGFRYAIANTDFLEGFGAIDHEMQLLEVRSSLESDQKNETVLHEVVHALEVAYGFKLPENVAGRLSRGLFAFMRDNPKFIRELL